jgi:glycosyltransferase involved in cell wall biosynthesis
VTTRYRVMHVVHGLDVGGLEIMLNRMVKRLDPSRFTCLVCCFDVRGTLAPDFEEAGIKVFFLPRKPRIDYRYPFRLAQLLRRQQIDLAHLHTEMGFIYGVLAARLAGTPGVLYTEHGRDFPASVRKTLANRVLSISGVHTVPVSAALRDDLVAYEHFPLSRMTVIPNGVPDPPRPDDAAIRSLRGEMGAADDDILLGTVGGLKKVKDHAGLIGAMPSLIARHPGARLAIVGGGILHEALQQEIRRLNLEKRVVLTGERKDVAPYLHAFDIFVLSSRNEGMPLCLLEGLAAGKPVVSMNVGGVSEALADGVEGFLIPPADYARFVERLAWLIEHPEDRKAMGQRGREKYLARFTIERMVSGYAALYDKLLAGFPPLGVSAPAAIARNGKHAGMPVPQPALTIDSQRAQTGTLSAAT